jgi:DNA-binding CsgD family transcriptional regulator
MTSTPTPQSLDGKCIASLIDALHSDRLMQQLWSFIDSLTDYDNSCAYLLSTSGGIARLCNRYDNADRARWHAKLEGGAYVLSPYFALIRSGARDDFYTMAQLAPDDFYESEYYRTFYLPAGCKDEAIFLARCDGEHYIALTLERLSNTTGFDASDVQRLRSCAAIVASLLRKHWRTSSARLQRSPGDATDMQDALAGAFQRFGQGVLTDREREVASLILRGHSSKSAARVLAIAAETERVHRKRLYAKLGISSQAELFSLFLSTSLQMRLDAGQDLVKNRFRSRHEADRHEIAR